MWALVLAVPPRDLEVLRVVTVACTGAPETYGVSNGDILETIKEKETIKEMKNVSMRKS
jgi:hypothetical protein